jgi:hypothetical protein
MQAMLVANLMVLLESFLVNRFLYPEADRLQWLGAMRCRSGMRIRSPHQGRTNFIAVSPFSARFFDTPNLTIWNSEPRSLTINSQKRPIHGHL